MKICCNITLILLVTSCEKVIDVNLNGSAPRLVVEGFITDDNSSAKVILSRSVNFDAANEFPSVSNAIVTISDHQSLSQTLTETTPGVYLANLFNGEIGKTYFLSVITNKESINSFSTIVNKINFDSARVEVKKKEQSKNDKYNVKVYFQDPVSETNYYRFVLYINGKREGGHFVYGDRLLNGRKFERKIPFDFTDLDIKKGDIFTVEMQCIDQKLFDYFRTRKANSFNQGQATPDNALTNIEGDGLGYFGAYTVQKHSIEIE